MTSETEETLNIEDWEDDTPPPPPRSDQAEMYIFDDPYAGAWAVLRVSVGHEEEDWGFTMVRDPRNSIRQFERDLAAGRTAQMHLPGEPGGTDILAEPDSPEGWVRLRIWTVDFKDDRTLCFEAFAPAEALARTMREKTGFLAVEYGLKEARYPRGTLGGDWQAFRDWLRSWWS